MPQSDYCEAHAVPLRPVVIRAMRADELGTLADLWVSSWQEAMPDIDFEARWAWVSAVLADPSNTVLVVEAEGDPKGFAVLAGPLLHQLVVAPAAKGGGLAIDLLAAAKSREPGGLTLEVNTGNPRALRFYEREGFRRVGEGRSASGLPTWHMRWLNPP